MQDDLTGAGRLTQPNENKIFFLAPKNKTNELNYQNQIRKSIQNLFSACTLLQHVRQPDVIQKTATKLLDWFMLCIVYCSCIMFTCSTSDFAAGNACFYLKPCDMISFTCCYLYRLISLQDFSLFRVIKNIPINTIFSLL